MPLFIFSKAEFISEAFIPNKGANFIGDNTTVTKKYPNVAASATAPSFFFAIPIATPIANKIPNCSKIVVPTVVKNIAIFGVA
ncbi:Uncharacterised protein [Staphylococcus aureus]|nr:Uncharacterised protein [Staphylococcus aureus]CPM76575.1 Uncharacterised protein [Staphylococcus aureus]